MAAITPITPLTSLERLVKLENIESIANNKTGETVGNQNYKFMDILKEMVSNINETDAETKNDAFNLAMGFTDMQDLHTIEINAIRADLALRTMTSVRNKVLEAYSEVMRITI